MIKDLINLFESMLDMWKVEGETSSFSAKDLQKNQTCQKPEEKQSILHKQSET